MARLVSALAKRWKMGYFAGMLMLFFVMLFALGVASSMFDPNGLYVAIAGLAGFLLSFASSLRFWKRRFAVLMPVAGCGFLLVEAWWLTGVLERFEAAGGTTTVPMDTLGPLVLTAYVAAPVMLVILAIVTLITWSRASGKAEAAQRPPPEPVITDGKLFKYCPGCLYQVEMESDDAFCPGCGRKLEIPKGM